MPDNKLPQADESARDRLLAEYEFVREGMRQDQRERLAFLGFAVAANSAALGLVVRDATSGPSSAQAFVLIGIALAVTIVAEVLTIRATIGVASAGHYLRKFVEPKVPELAFQTRNPRFLAQFERADTGKLRRVLMRASVSSSSGLAVAYGMLTAVLLVAWFTVDLSTSRSTWQSAAMLIVGCVSGGLASLLLWTTRRGARHVGEAWEAVKAEEGDSSS